MLICRFVCLCHLFVCLFLLVLLLGPSAPVITDVKVRGFAQRSIVLEWDEPYEPKGVIIRYHVRYWRSGEQMEEAVIISLDADEIEDRRMLKLEGIYTNSTYHIQVI